MKISHPKKKHFKTSIALVFNKLSGILDDRNYKYSINDCTMVINEPEDDRPVKKIIAGTVREVFDCRRASKYCKLNVIGGRMFVRFKNVI